MRHFLFLIPLLLAGCAGSVDYSKPAKSAGPVSIVVNHSKDDLMQDLPQLLAGKHFFVGRGAARGNAFVASYSGNPEPYVDCGRIVAKSGARSEHTLEFPGARAQQNYEVMVQGAAVKVDRRMTLEATLTYLLAEAGAGKTRVTATTRYAITRTSFVNSGGAPVNATDSIAFSTGESKAFDNRWGQNTECRGTGKLEAEALAAIR